MPKPGAWMETLKQFLAFPLYATAIWLLWVAGRQTGVNTMAAALAGALILALGLWLWRYGNWRKAVALACVLAAASLGSWRALDENGNRAAGLAADRVAWSEQHLAELRAAGTPVFVDVTADWCITCLANESAVLFTDEMTRPSPPTAWSTWWPTGPTTMPISPLPAPAPAQRHSAIPHVPRRPTGKPLLLPQILTNDTVLDALRDHFSKKAAIAVN